MSEILVKYDVTDAAIEELRAKYSIVPVIENNKTLKEVKGRITAVRKLRTSVESRRKELKKDALEYGRKVDAEANRIKAELLVIEKPMKDAQAEYEEKVAAEKAELKRIEAERRAEMQARIDSISDLVVKNVSSSSFEIASVMDHLSEPDGYEWGEYLMRKNEAVTKTLEALGSLLSTAQEQEREAAAAAERERLAEVERAKLEAERKALAEQQAEQDRLNAEREAAAAAERERLAAIEAKIKAEREAIEQEKRDVISKENARIEADQAEQRRVEAEKQALVDAEKKEVAALAASMVTCPHCQKEFSLREVSR